MRRAKRMTIIVMAAALATTLLASAFPAAAQTFDPRCGGEALQRIDSDLFVCIGGSSGFFCPEGFVEVPVPEDPVPPEGGVLEGGTDPSVLDPSFLCAPEPSDSDGGDSGGGDNGDGGGHSGGGGGSGSSGGGSGGSGGGSAPITQDVVQESEAGQMHQNFDIS
jgi:hypothetical protein